MGDEGPLVVKQMYPGQAHGIIYPWLKELGKKIISVNPQQAYTAYFADKWIPVIPGTDAALAAAIAYVWISESTYDKQYLDTHAIGFDENTLPAGAPPKSSFKSYITGEQDGVPKTPGWAEKITGVKARETRALAREWASQPTMLLAYCSGACRGAYNYEWTRMMVTLQAMQGLGKPGVNIWDGVKGSPIDPRNFGLSGYADGGIPLVANKKYSNPIKQVITEGYVDKAILDPPATWTGGSSLGGGVNLAFTKYVFPMSGYSDVKMIHQHGASNLHQDADINHWIRVYQSPKIEFVMIQAPWFETDATYSDIYLPITTPFENNDVTEASKTAWKIGYTGTPSIFSLCVAVYHQKCIDTLWAVT